MAARPDFARFDRRRYPTVTVREGYDAWAPTYEQSVEDVMDLALLERIGSVAWDRVTRAADLGCGSGRIADWRTRGDFPVDGVDVTPAMIERARDRGVPMTSSSASWSTSTCPSWPASTPRPADCSARPGRSCWSGSTPSS